MSTPVECLVVEVLPKRLFLVRAEDGRTFQAGLGLTGKLVVRVASGDRVLVHPSTTDPKRARIVEKLIP